MHYKIQNKFAHNFDKCCFVILNKACDCTISVYLLGDDETHGTIFLNISSNGLQSNRLSMIENIIVRNHALLTERQLGYKSCFSTRGPD